jgi:rare lipoprotein A
MASYYSDIFHGRKTASGETYDKWAFTCAHRKLAFGTKLVVTNLANKRSVLVRVNDRGPFVKGRIIDLSYAAAEKIGMIAAGVVKVKVEQVR